jgi:CheY-like chemotaxis protein
MNYLQHILLADDNPYDVELALEALKEFNLENRVVVVNDGVEALEYLRCEGKFTGRTTGQPAVLLLDIKMPRMDGIQVLEAIRSEPNLKLLPVVMLTSSREEKDMTRSYELGTNAYVVKPVGFQEFVEVVNHIGLFWANLNQLPTKEN